jgi:hypothetical protein
LELYKKNFIFVLVPLVDENNILIEHKTFVMYLVEGGILHIKYNEDINIEVDDIKLIQKIYSELAEPKPRKIIQDLSFGITMTPEAMKYGAENYPEFVVVAYVIKGLGHRLLVRFYTKMRRIDKPTKIFENFDEAKCWLDTI